MLAAYKGLASFYTAMGKKDLAARTCQQYDEAEQLVLGAGDEYSVRYRETKYKPSAAALRADIDRLKAKTRKLLLPPQVAEKKESWNYSQLSAKRPSFTISLKQNLHTGFRIKHTSIIG